MSAMACQRCESVWKKRGIWLLPLFVVLLTGCKNIAYAPSSYMGAGGTAVSLSVEEGTVTPAGLVLQIQNLTDLPIAYDAVYTLERRMNGAWYRLAWDESFNALGMILDENDENTCEIEFFEPLEKGEYRIIKAFSMQSQRIEADAEFSVE